jgi:lipid-A-disaccharide synthase
MTSPTVMLVAAEASGDTLGAGLARALRRKNPAIRFVGIGGRRMAAEGIDSPFDIRQLSVLGLFEGLAAYRKVLARVKDATALAAREKPDVAVLIDSWGFNLRLAHALRKLNPDIKLIKYVGPQVWASRPGRAKTLAAVVDHLLATLPFDAPFYEPYGLPVTFVGNPALAVDFSGADGGRFRKAMGFGKNTPILLILPGSRPSEIERMTAPFEAAAAALKNRFPDLELVVPVASTVSDLVHARISGWPFRVHFVDEDEAKMDAMKAATAALACSGTATTELALAGAPMVVGYRIGGATYAILKRLIRTPWIVLLNIAAGRMVVPELIQGECTGDKLAAELEPLLADQSVRAGRIAAQNAALEAMGRGGPDPAGKAADVVLGYLADVGP